MKQALTIILILFCIASFGQSDFKPGYVIKENGDTLTGTIDYRGDKKMSAICKFKPLNSNEITEYNPKDIKEFRFENSKCYVSKTLESGEDVFLEYLIKGELNIYYYRNNKGFDNYLIDKEGFPLKVIPYTEGEKKNKDGELVFYKSKLHIGVLNVYTSDAPELQEKSKTIIKPEHKNLIKYAEDYHNTVCKDESCIVFSKDIPLLKALFELNYGLSYYHEEFYNLNKSDRIEILAYFWQPRASEKLYFKTGLIYSGTIEDDKPLLIIPTQLYYQYSHFKLRPSLHIGINHYYVESGFLMAFASGIGLNYNIINNISITGSFNSDFTPFGDTKNNWPGFTLLSNSITIGLRYEL